MRYKVGDKVIIWQNCGRWFIEGIVKSVYPAHYNVAYLEKCGQHWAESSEEESNLMRDYSIPEMFKQDPLWIVKGLLLVIAIPFIALWVFLENFIQTLKKEK